MGCKNSKAAAVRTVTSGTRKRVSPMDDVTTPQKQTIVINDKNTSSKKSLKKPFSRGNSVNGSMDSILDLADNNDSDRFGSAGSKRSKQSNDSGLGDNYAHFITENSDPNLVKQVESDFLEKDDLDLCVSGTACPRLLSAKDKERQEEQRVLAALREEGLIARPKSRAVGGLAFEITEDETDTFKRPPRLAKLELKRRKKKKVLTEEQIKEKLEKAEERKKLKEAERLARINQLEKNTKTALDTFEQSQKQKEYETLEEQQKRIEVALDNREKKLKALREKLRRKAEHAETVRQRKKLNLDTVSDLNNADDGLESQQQTPNDNL
ncbi:uncharacterized protein LOC141900410 [Tubulanus polymorphus]|uniref:uncharacterized protein LOC141900410 n=1 Tax=Tubulanus polymorphus TaxID=672921 RepID=UPI003DA4B2F7